MPLDVARIQRRVLAVLPDASVIDLSPALTGLAREDAAGELATRLTVQVDASTEVRGKGSLGKVLALGVRLLEMTSLDGGATEVETFRGPLWDRTRDGDGLLEITAYDDLIYLGKSDDTRQYPAGLSGQAVLRDLCTAWSIPVRRIDGPTVSMPKLAFSGSLADLVMQVLQHGLASGDKAYWARMVEGQLEVTVPGGNSPIYVLDETASVSAATDHMSLEDVRTEIRVLGATAEDTDQRRPPLVATAAGDVATVGRLVATLDGQAYDSPARAEAAARIELAKRSVPITTSKRHAAAIPTLRKGDVVVVRALGLDGPVQVAGIAFDEDADEMDIDVVKVGTPLYQARLIQEQQAPSVSGAGGSGAIAVVKPGGKRAALLAWAKAHLGVPYVWGGKSARGWDCSGYTTRAYEAIGISIGDGTGGQESNPNNPLVSSPQPGDLVFFPGHVGIVSEDTSRMYNALDETHGTVTSSIGGVAASLGGGPRYRRPRGLDS